MWPFNSRKTREERIAECDHEWEEKTMESTHPQGIYHEDGEIYIHKVNARTKNCIHCPKVKESKRSEKKVYLEVSRTEIVYEE